MLNKRLFILAVALLLLPVFAGAAAAQDTAEDGTTEIGALTLTLPDVWTARMDNDGAVLIANVNLYDPELSNEDLPEDLIQARLIIAGTDLLLTEEDTLSAQTLLEAIPLPEGAEPDFTTLEDRTRDIARVSIPEEAFDTASYVAVVSDETFAFLIVATAELGMLADIEADFLNMLDTLVLDVTATVPDYIDGRYDGIEVGTSEEGFPTIGSADAPVQIIEISSFDCGACGFYHEEVFPAILERVAAGEVQFTYVPIFGTGSLADGAQAAIASLCAAEQGAFWPYHDMLFSWQEINEFAYVGERLTNGFEALGLDTDAYNTCVAEEATIPVIEAAFTYAQGTGFFQGTPTVIVNGQPVVNSLEALEEAVTAALDSE